MTAKRAKTLDNSELHRVLSYVGETSMHPLRDYVVVLLSFKAGLRVGEIAGLDWTDVTDAFGVIRTKTLTVPSDIAKKGSGRTVPMHPALYAALVAWHAQCSRGGRKIRGGDPIIPQTHAATQRVQPNTLTQYIRRLYTKLGLEGCSSHSGRRSFLTNASRLMNKHGCSMRDVQMLAGHRHLDTTEAYLEPSDNIDELVKAL